MDEKQQAFKDYADAMAKTDVKPVFRSEAYAYPRHFQNTINNGSIKSEYNHADYAYFRQGEADPTCIEEEIAMCLKAYDKYPIVSNIMDLMADFGSQGVRVVCADKRQEKFGQEWFNYVEGPEVCAKFLLTLFRAGTTIIKRTDGKVPIKVQKKWKSTAADMSLDKDPPGSDIVIKDIETKKATIPLKYTIYNPLQVVMIGGMLSQFVGKPIFGLRITPQLRYEINQLPRLARTGNDYEKLKKLIPDYVTNAIAQNALFFPLDQSKISAFYYKKDDWNLWGKTIIGPILRDLKVYDKLQLCDMSALDGAISAIRLWRSGSMEHGIVPSEGMLLKIQEMLSNNISGGTMDMVWGPDLDFKESQTTLHHFLGPDKYTQTIANIYAGLGIPSGLTGNASGSTTESFTGLKTLIERLKYSRNILIKFWTEQFKLVQEAMGFTKPFKLLFDQLMLSDEAAEKNVLLQMWDRDIISTETLRYNTDITESDIEDAKISKEYRRRGKTLPPKASQFHNPQMDDEKEKLFIQKGGITPTQVGLELAPKGKDEETPNEENARLNPAKKFSPTGSPLTGRPAGAKDKEKRKKKRVLPKGASANFSSLFSYAEQAQAKIDELVIPAFLEMAGKKYIRSLTVEESNNLELIKFRMLSSFSPSSSITHESIASLNTDEKINEGMLRLLNKLVGRHQLRYGRLPNTTERRKLECEAYAYYFSKKSV